MKIARLTCLLVAFVFIPTGLCQDKYTDENRPYKFGFNIEGYQHRHEEKDEKGIIKGEYGFITADGYYRVTVYATDENGSFRIISMKNYYVGFPPEDPTTTPQPPSARGQVPNRASINPPPNALSYQSEGQVRGGGEEKKQPVEVTGLTACSDCLIPTTKKPGQGLTSGLTGNSVRNRGGSDFGNLTGGQRGSGGNVPAHNREGGRKPPFGSQTPGSGRGSTRFPGSGHGNEEGNFLRKTSEGADSRFPSGGSSRGGGEGANPQFPSPGRTRGEGGGGSRENTNRGSSGFRGSRPDGIVRDGLPNGVTMDDIKALLYKFNYTVGFHGHHEDGYRNGDKEGDYFFDGRDGVERKVEYIANEFGYQPNITFIDLPENDERRPNELTEKDYGLKGYEFKWFYRK